MENEKQYASKHYAYYPKGDFPAYLAYGFRPILLLLAPYIVISIILWSLAFSGYINLSFISNLLKDSIFAFYLEKIKITKFNT